MTRYEKILLASLGLLSVSAKETKRVLRAVKDKKPSEKTLEEFLANMVKEGQEMRKESEKKVRDVVRQVLKELDIPTRSELKTLEKKLSGRTRK